MRVLIAAAFAVSFAASSVAQDPYLKGEALLMEIENNCAGGCIVFNQEEALEYEKQLNEMVSRRQEEAFKAGVEFQKQACPSLVNLL